MANTIEINRATFKILLESLKEAANHIINFVDAYEKELDEETSGQ